MSRVCYKLIFIIVFSPKLHNIYKKDCILKAHIITILKIKKLWHKAENYAKIYLENINGD